MVSKLLYDVHAMLHHCGQIVIVSEHLIGSNTTIAGGFGVLHIGKVSRLRDIHVRLIINTGFRNNLTNLVSQCICKLSSSMAEDVGIA